MQLVKHTKTCNRQQIQITPESVRSIMIFSSNSLPVSNEWKGCTSAKCVAKKISIDSDVVIYQYISIYGNAYNILEM